MDLGLDIGTSAVKAVVVDEAGSIAAEAAAPLSLSHPQPGWSEQNPDEWWRAAEAAIVQLPKHTRAQVRSIGLSGQMHGLCLLDERDRPLRPCILWNDGRAERECAVLEAAAPFMRAITGNAAMAGFSAPKLLWVSRKEPEIFRATRRILLPKDYVRLLMTGDAASDVSDSSGTLWLDVSARRWSPAMLAACELSERHMPQLYEGNQVCGLLRREFAESWGVPCAPVVAGAGDNAAGAVGAGVIRNGRALLSLGTSGVVFAATDRFSPAPSRGAHAFCHALPNLWHQMAVILSAASCLSWAASVLGFPHVAAALATLESHEPFTGETLFAPYLSGERTPHNDPHARGAFVGLTLSADRSALFEAVLEGVAFALADGVEVLADAGTFIDRLAVIGGGARSRHWGRILAAALQRPLDYSAQAHVGPALGAARLARLAVTGEAPADICTQPPIVDTLEPERDLIQAAAAARIRFKHLYPALRSLS